MSVNFSNVKIFDGFLKKSGLSSVPVYKPVEADSGDDKSPKFLASVAVGDVNSQNKNGRHKVFGIIGVSVGTAVLLTLVGFFFLSKGFSADFAKKFSKISLNIKNTIAELSTQTKKLTPSQKLKLKLTQAVQPVAETLEASANITAIKDSSMNKLLKKLKLERFVKVINKFFKDKIVLTTKNNAYKKAELSVVEFCNYVEKLANEEKNPELAKRAKSVISAYTKSFSVKEHVSRTNRNWEKMNGLSDEVFNRLFKYEGNIKQKFGKIADNIKNMRSYITISLTEKQRDLLKTELGKSQNTVMDRMKDVIDVVPENKMETVKKLFSKADKSLSSAIASEIKSFNKLAEIQVGSVATDILGIIVPSALATCLVINSENKNQRIGKALTKGIPIMGGIGVSYYGSTRGFTGAKNLVLGLSTAMLLNIIGSRANESYKKYSERQLVLRKAFDSLNKLQSNKDKDV